MQDAQDCDFAPVDFVEESVIVKQPFTDTGVCEFRHYAPALGQRTEAFGQAENFFEKGQGGGGRVARNVGYDLIEVGARPRSPDYFAPRCHLVLSSRMTSS